MSDIRPIRFVGADSRTARRRPGGPAVVIAAIFAMASLAADALPVIPEGAGYGMETRAGRGGQVHRVTNLNESGVRSLKACIDATGPRVCVFEVSGTIQLTDDLVVRNPYITIAGQTAPSPGIMLRGAALKIVTTDVLVQHLRIRAGDAAIGPARENRDALKIEVPVGSFVNNVVIDHCSLSWGMDETVSLWGRWNNVTIRNSIIAEGLRDHSNGVRGGSGLLAGGMNAGRLALVGNLFAHNAARNPLARAPHLVFVNNVVYNFLRPSVDLQSEYGTVTNNSIVGNVFILGPDAWDLNKTIEVRTGELGLPTTSKVYVNDNQDAGVIPPNPWAVVNPDFPASIEATRPPAWVSGLVRLPVSNNLVLNDVLRYVGARPANRDTVDARVVGSVRTRTGRLVNCVSPDGSVRCRRHAGGWPTLAVNRRALTLPTGHTVVEPSGYTRLELWLQRMAAQVEGRPASPPAVQLLQ